MYISHEYQNYENFELQNSHMDKLYRNLKYKIDKPKVVSRNQKSKADDLVFIKITISNNPPTPPTPTRKSFKEAR